MAKNGCKGKRRYPDHSAAIQAMRCLERNSTREVIPHRAYYCHPCRGWHTTSKPNIVDKIVEKLVAVEIEAQ